MTKTAARRICPHRGGAPDEPETEQEEVSVILPPLRAEAVRRRIEQGQTQKDAVKAVSAEVSGVKEKNALYRYVLENE